LESKEDDDKVVVVVVEVVVVVVEVVVESCEFESNELSLLLETVRRDSPFELRGKFALLLFESASALKENITSVKIHEIINGTRY